MSHEQHDYSHFLRIFLFLLLITWQWQTQNKTIKIKLLFSEINKNQSFLFRYLNFLSNLPLTNETVTQKKLSNAAKLQFLNNKICSCTIYKNAILFPKLLWSIVKENCPSDKEKMFKFQRICKIFEITRTIYSNSEI
jgi:hypothetical protein